LMHIWGIPLAAIVAFQVPYHIWRAAGGSPLQFASNFVRWVRIFVIISILVPWALKTLWTFAIILT
jgi:hypothetical protein